MSQVESFEPRRLFAVTLTDGVLTITGTGQGDQISVYAVPTALPELVNVNVKVLRFRDGSTQVIQASREVFRFDRADVDSVVIDSRGGDDRVDIDPEALIALADVRTGAGDDSVTGAATQTRVHLGDGADQLSQAARGYFRVFGQGGDDTIQGSQKSDIIDGGDGDDSINGSGGGDTIRGGADNDFIEGDGNIGNGGDDLIFGDDGDDTLRGNRGNDTLDGGAGDDLLSGWSGNDRLYGGDGNDDLSGHSGSDGIYGGLGNDDIFGDDSPLYDDSPEDAGANPIGETP